MEMTRFKWAIIAAGICVLIDALLSLFPSVFWIKTVVVFSQLFWIWTVYEIQNAPSLEEIEENKTVEHGKAKK